MRDKLKEMGKGLLRKYAQFVVYRAPLVLALFLVFTLVMGYQASFIETAGASQQEHLPQDIEVLKSFNLIADQFAESFSSSTIVVETDPSYARSDEIRDVRDPEALRYVDVLTKRATLIYGVIDAKSAADMIKEANGGRIPSSLQSVKQLLKENEVAGQVISRYISDDYRMSVVRLKLLENVDENEVVEGLREVIRVDKPPGLNVEITGDPVIFVTMIELVQETMQITSFVSLALIILILILVFASIKYGLTPLLTIILGTIWTYGVLNLAGFNVTPETSGVLALIMGIGIDFGIQVTKRFRYELQLRERKEAMVNTLCNVFYPLSITAVAAVTGFLSLKLGELPMMSDWGTMMACGVLFCMIAALTVVPAILLFFERKKDVWERGPRRPSPVAYPLDR
ncbi:MAG: MMPL family transporter [archaeon]|nr:MMPL family transporter [archaeon]